MGWFLTAGVLAGSPKPTEDLLYRKLRAALRQNFAAVGQQCACVAHTGKLAWFAALGVAALSPAVCHASDVCAYFWTVKSCRRLEVGSRLLHCTFGLPCFTYPGGREPPCSWLDPGLLLASLSESTCEDQGLSAKGRRRRARHNRQRTCSPSLPSCRITPRQRWPLRRASRYPVHLELIRRGSCLLAPCHAWLWHGFWRTGQTQQITWSSCPRRMTCGPRALFCQIYRPVNGPQHK